MEKVKKIETMPGVVCWRKSVPVENVVVYSGRKCSVVFNIINACHSCKIAGCKNIIVATPANKNGK